jgi:lipopolysaccharide biosynthesis glycosyltransferase
MAYGDRSIWLGFDDREAVPYAVARHSVIKNSQFVMPVHGVVMNNLHEAGWYKRPTAWKPSATGPILWDNISDAPMSTMFAISRFFVPKLATHYGYNDGWALFADSDIIVRDTIDDVFTFVEQHNDKALFCVQHYHDPQSATKKGGTPQARVNDPRYPGTYSRKNWSSVMLFNLSHPSNQKLTFEMLNEVPGRDLHRFCWLDDDEIGSLDVRWNHLAGVEGAGSADPTIVHFTLGGPWLSEYADVEYAEEWRELYREWIK